METYLGADYALQRSKSKFSRAISFADDLNKEPYK
jgi:hypothetical protein